MIRLRLSKMPPYYAIILAAAVILVALAIVGETSAQRSNRLLRASRADLARFNELRDQFMKGHGELSPVEKRLLTPLVKESVSAIVEEISAAIGINKRISSVKSVDVSPEKGYQMNGAEFHIDGLTLNQVVNLLYRIENHPNMLLVKDLSIKSRFDNSNMMDVTIQVHLISKQA